MQGLSSRYKAFAGAISSASVLFMLLISLCVAPAYASSYSDPQSYFDASALSDVSGSDSSSSVHAFDGEGVCVDGASLSADDVVTYRVYWVNQADSACAVTVSDQLPEGVTLVAGTIESDSSGVSLGRGSYDEALRTISWTSTSVPPHASGSVSFKVSVDKIYSADAALSTLSNVAKVNGESLSVDLSAQTQIPSVLDPSVYVASSNVASSTTDENDADRFDAEGLAQAGLVKDHLDQLDLDASSVQSAGDHPVSSDSNESLSDAAMSSQVDSLADYVSAPLVSSPHLSLYSSGVDANGGLVGVGDELSYVVSWSNDATGQDGQATDASLVFSIDVPAGTEFSGFLDSEASEGSQVYPNQDGTHLMWTVSAKAGESGSLGFKASVLESSVGLSLVADCSLSAEGGTAAVSNQVVCSVPRLSVDPDDLASDDASLANSFSAAGLYASYNAAEGLSQDQIVTCTLSFTAPDSVAQVHAKLPLGLVVSGDASVKDGSVCQGRLQGGAADGQQATWDLYGLQKGQEVAFSFKVKAATDCPAGADISASVNGHAANSVHTPAPSAVSLHAYRGNDIVDDSSVSVGETLSYRVAWLNDSESVGPVTVVVHLPEGVELVEGSLNGQVEGVSLGQATYDSRSRTLTWRLDGLQAGAQGVVGCDVVVHSAYGEDGSSVARAAEAMVVAPQGTYPL